jgi:septal ring factor EnvC (AmiA/AmiB activator)
MDKVKKEGYFFFFATGFLIGGLIGILAFNCLISYRIDQYHEKIRTLEAVIEDKDTRLEKLEDTINKKRLVVKKIEVTLEKEEDELTKITLQKHIKEKLDKFIGREVDKIDADMLWEIIDKRIMKIKDKEYRLKVSKLMVSEVIHIWVEVSSGS